MAWMLFAMTVAAPTARGEDGADDVSKRLEALESRASMVEGLVKRIGELEGQVTHLKGQLAQYESQDATRAAMRYQIVQAEVARAMAEHDAAINGDGSGYGEGFEVVIWGWLTYLYHARPGADRSTFWAWEVEVDITKTFNEWLAAGIDLDFVDVNGNTRTEIEQAFLSILLSDEDRTVLTVGAFNSPFGAEPRDFWDRKTGTVSLLFDAIPHDLVGALLTQPIGDTGVTVQPFIVNGWDNDLDVNGQPSVGVVLKVDPADDLHFAVTNWYGPEMAGNNSDKAYFVLVEGAWQVTPTLLWEAQYVYGTTESPMGRQQWMGAMTLVDVDLNDRMHVFTRFSYLDDRDGFITGAPDTRYEVAVGAGIHIERMVELRFEYRHEFVESAGDLDIAEVHVTFGF